MSLRWVSQGRCNLLDVVQHEVTDTSQVCPLKIGVKVDLDNTVVDGGAELVDGGTRTAVEDKHHGLLLVALKLLADVGLVLAEELRVQLDVAGLVHAVDAEGLGLAKPHTL